jgi:hypothetical protein
MTRLNSPSSPASASLSDADEWVSPVAWEPLRFSTLDVRPLDLKPSISDGSTRASSAASTFGRSAGVRNPKKREEEVKQPRNDRGRLDKGGLRVEMSNQLVKRLLRMSHRTSARLSGLEAAEPEGRCETATIGHHAKRGVVYV